MVSRPFLCSRNQSFLAVNPLLVLESYVVSLSVSQFAVVGYALVLFEVLE